jgi:hypothetical protein
MKKLIFFVFLMLPLFIFAQDDDESKVAKTAKWGVYITNIYDANLAENSFKIDFWWWSNQTDTSLTFEETVDIPDAKSLSTDHFERHIVGPMVWEVNKISTEVTMNWDILNYPFDKPQLVVRLESSIDEISKLQITADSLRSSINKKIEIKNLVVDSFYLTQGEVPYNTDFGDPAAEYRCTYAGLFMKIDCHRAAWGIYFKLCIGLFIAFLISYLAFFIEPEYFDARFGTSVGGLFAAVGNKYVCESQFPSSATFTLIDKIHALVFILIFLVMTIITISLYFKAKDQLKTAKKIDRFFALIIGIAFIAGVTWLTYKSY